MTRSPSPTRAAKALSLCQFVATWREGVLTLDQAAYDDLRECGLNRADVAAAVDDLVADGRATVTARLGRIRVSVAATES